MINSSLIIFICQGREHLLEPTYRSFRTTCNYQFKKIILAIDGQVSPASISLIQPDLIVQSYNRKGYVNSITNAIKNIDSEYFFWLEDDWNFPHPFNLEDMETALTKDDSLIQIVLSKQNKVDTTDLTSYVNDYRRQTFSANPCLCRTQDIRAAFEEINVIAKTDSTKLMGFENFLDAFMLKNNLYSLIRFKDGASFVHHAGDLESTPREYHMINSIDETKSSIEKEYISGYGYNKKITLLNKIALLPKLIWCFIVLSFNLFFDRKSYDIAFRIYLLHKRGFK